MNYLLDTHTFLWWITDDERLSDRARILISTPENTIFVSAATGWEIVIKHALDRLKLSEDPRTYIPAQIMENDFITLNISMSHVLRIVDLPNIHRDPFDRLLVAQSQIERVPLISKDETIQKYAVNTVW